MPDTLQEKLLKMEIAPPTGVWDKISATLNEEYQASDSLLATKIDNIEITAPAGIWDNIQNELNPAILQQKQGKIIPLVYKRIAIAAMVVGLVSLAVIFLNSKEKQSVPVIVKSVPAAPPPTRKTDTSSLSHVPLVADNRGKQTNEHAQVTRVPLKTVSHKRAAIAEYSLDDIAESASDDETASSPEQAPLYELTTVSALQPVSVSAPPLRDKQGNLILDFASISNAGDAYITVTGPNGKQTKISSKFLSCLGYMNSNPVSSEMDARALRCKSQFEEWRNRLLSEPAFIPTANNFFDIFELKDMLQEM